MTFVALSYQYASRTTVSAVSNFSAAAPNLYDGSIGDTTTNHTSVQGSNSWRFEALIDLGASGPPVTKFTGVQTGFTASNSSWTLYGSNDGTTWTSVATGPNTSPMTATFTAVTWRYWQIFITGSGGPGASVGMSDFRLYDSSSVVIAGPSFVLNKTTVAMF